jgi:hypothetical protein
MDSRNAYRIFGAIPENFYAPKDFGNDRSYLESMRGARKARIERFTLATSDLIKRTEEQIENMALRNSGGDRVDKNEAKREAKRVTKEITETTYLSIDLSAFRGASFNSVLLPTRAYPTFDELTDDLYFMISEKVRPFAYGYDWIIQDKVTKKRFSNRRMIEGVPPGGPCPDQRSLEEVGIGPGMTLEVIPVQGAPTDVRNQEKEFALLDRG